MSESHFLLGVLIVRDRDRHIDAIRAWREELGFRQQMAYSKTDRRKVALCTRALDYFVDQDDMEFQSMLIPTAQYDLRYYRAAPAPAPAASGAPRVTPGPPFTGRSAAVTSYNYRYKQLLLNNLSRRERAVVLLDERSRAEHDNLTAYITREVPGVRETQLVDSAQHDLIQLVDLLTGSVFGDVTNVQHAVKRGLIDHLKSRLGVARLTDQRLTLARKYRVHIWEPPTQGGLQPSAGRGAGRSAGTHPANGL